MRAKMMILMTTCSIICYFQFLSSVGYQGYENFTPLQESLPETYGRQEDTNTEETDSVHVPIPASTSRPKAAYREKSSKEDQLIQEWKVFEDYWNSHINEYHKTNESKQEVPYKRIPDYLTVELPKDDVILAAHMSMSIASTYRLDVLERFWQGPISLAVRIRSQQEIEDFFDYYHHTHTRTNFTIHFLFEYANTFDPNSFPYQYCHNRLRNMALHSESIPDYVFATDLDFIPAFGTYPKLKQIMEKYPDTQTLMQNKTVLVLPVLEVLHIPDSLNITNASTMVNHPRVQNYIQSLGENATNTANRTRLQRILYPDKELKIRKQDKPGRYTSGLESDLPLSRQELKVLYILGLAKEWHTPESQTPTDINQFWSYNDNDNDNDNSTYYPLYKISPSRKYEPYFIGYKQIMPKYWEAYRGFGFNKQSFVRELILQGFDFHVFYQLYVTHLAHPSRTNKFVKYTNRMVWKNDFAPYLEETYKEPPEKLPGKPKDWYGRPG